MKTYFNQYRPFFIFLLKFFLVYGGLTFLYQLYLNQFENPLFFQVDGFTQFVANQTEKLLLFFNYDASLAAHDHQASVKLFLNSIYTARIVEGCNGLSVMILFIAFVIAFSGKWKQTVLFILAGIVTIHVLNIIRIAMLCVLLQKYPTQESLLHEVIFPLFIYGAVFGLWVIWVNKFSTYAAKNPKK